MEKDATRTLVLRVGAEGGSLSVTQVLLAGGSAQFEARLKETDYSLAQFDSVDESLGMADSFAEALMLLDRYRWHRFMLIEIATDYQAFVLQSVEDRGGVHDRERWESRIPDSGNTRQNRSVLESTAESGPSAKTASRS